MCVGGNQFLKTLMIEKNVKQWVTILNKANYWDQISKWKGIVYFKHTEKIAVIFYSSIPITFAHNIARKKLSKPEMYNIY